MRQARSQRVEVDGWIVLDKPAGITSTAAVSRLKRVLNAKKAGHAGTLDPLASGVLPVAFGEATKTVPVVQDGAKTYRFTAEWGVETDTDDAEGVVVSTSDLKPTEAAIKALLPRFIGTIEQRPPSFSAVKIAGKRAYQLARDGSAVDLASRAVTIYDLAILSCGETSTAFAARCGKGTYVRAIARDLGRMLGCYGHIKSLRRTRVGPFREQDARSFDELDEPAIATAALQPVAAGLDEISHILVGREDASRLRRGQPILLRTRDAPASGLTYATCAGVVIAFGTIDQGTLVPSRVFNLPF